LDGKIIYYKNCGILLNKDVERIETVRRSDDTIPDVCAGHGGCLVKADAVVATFDVAPLKFSKISEFPVTLNYKGKYIDDDVRVDLEVQFYFDHVGYEGIPTFVSSSGANGVDTRLTIKQKTKHAMPQGEYTNTNCIFDIENHGIDVNLHKFTKTGGEYLVCKDNNKGDTCNDDAFTFNVCGANT